MSAGRDRVPLFHYPVPLLPADDHLRSGAHLRRRQPRAHQSHCLYVHIPFCETICSFCPFIKTKYSDALAQEYVACLEKECELLACTEWVQGTAFSSIYLGGGTPTTLEAEVLANVLAMLRRRFWITDDVEITVEGNPASFPREKMLRLRDAGVNRVSLGIQTFDREAARDLHMAQADVDVERCIADALGVGFRRVNLDLIYNLPGQTLDAWRWNLERAIATGAPQLSLFPLALPPFTPLSKTLDDDTRRQLLDDEREFAFYQTAVEVLGAAGFEQHTNVDWMRPGEDYRHCRQHFQELADIMGLGAAAFGDLGGEAYLNTGDVRTYLQEIRSGRLAMVKHSPSSPDSPRKHVVLKLKMLSLARGDYLRRFGRDVLADFGDVLRPFERLGWLSISEDRISATLTGGYYLNDICKAIFKDECGGKSPFDVSNEKIARAQ